jgi:hypothetical protein
MMRGSKRHVFLSTEEREALERLVRGHNTAQKLVRRARIVLAAAVGEKYQHIAGRLPV